jgi:hypothetical protein
MFTIISVQKEIKIWMNERTRPIGPICHFQKDYRLYIYIYLEKLPLCNGGNHHRGSSGCVQDMLLEISRLWNKYIWIHQVVIKNIWIDEFKIWYNTCITAVSKCIWLASVQLNTFYIQLKGNRICFLILARDLNPDPLITAVLPYTN